MPSRPALSRVDYGSCHISILPISIPTPYTDNTYIRSYLLSNVSAACTILSSLPLPPSKLKPYEPCEVTSRSNNWPS